MINTGLSTKAYSSAPQESSLKVDKTNYLSPQEQALLPQGKELGEILNEVADPNYVDPSKNRKVGNNQLDKDAFFKLMLAQIKHQDPTNPMKSDQMAAQLAQFTSLEQLQNMNTKLDDLTKAQAPSQSYQALNFIGKAVAADTSQIIRGAGDKNHELRFQLAGDAAKVNIKIKNDAGEEVRSYQIAQLKKGENKISWNGLDNNQNPTREGQYYFEIEAVNTSGAKIAAQTSFKGKVTGVNFSKEGPVLMIGDQSIRVSDVSKIEDFDLKNDLEKSEKDSTGLALKNENNDEKNEIPGAVRGLRNNLEDFAMSQKVKDTTKK